MTNPSLSGRGKSLTQCCRAACPSALEREAKALVSSDSRRAGSTSAPPIAIVDIGSNSVRLVVYEGLTRAPTPIFNEKVMCGLGRGVTRPAGSTERGDADARSRRCARFRVLCDTLRVGEFLVMATAGGARRARTAQEFIAAARGDRRADRIAVRPARSAVLRARRRLGLPQARRHRRRSRRRLARTDRRPRPQGRRWRDAPLGGLAPSGRVRNDSLKKAREDRRAKRWQVSML
ncbi:MAG: hypothetical protein QM722_01030 [Piscinibacter sp.]